jgi:hypothetical protein
MKASKQHRHSTRPNLFTYQVVVHWKTLLGFIVIVILIAVSLSATAKAGHNMAQTETKQLSAATDTAESRRHRV